MSSTRAHQFIPAWNILWTRTNKYVATLVEMTCIECMGIMVIYRIDIVVPLFRDNDRATIEEISQLCMPHNLLIRVTIPPLLALGTRK